MSTITLRNTKGSPLTNTEVDNNFSNLNTDKLESTYSGAMNSLTGGTSIATVGTITAGTWSATAIGATKGGTGQTTYATGDLLYASATNTLSKLTKPATASYLKMAADGTPSWDTLGLDDITAVGTITVGTWNAGIIAPAYGGTGIANNSANTLTFTGNFALGVTLSANTSVTLPTTGTLATLAGAESLTNKKLGSLTSNGLVTTSGGDGTLSVTTTLGVANGGTGLTSLTATYVPYGNGTAALSSSNKFTFDGTVLSILYGSASGATYAANQPIRIDSNSNTGFAIGIPSTGGIVGGHYVNAGANTYDGGWEYQGTTRVLSLRAAGTNYLSINATGAVAVNGSYGTSGQVLTSAGSGAVPTWATNNAATTGKAIAMAMVFGG